jgi:hypothetical protein
MALNSATGPRFFERTHRAVTEGIHYGQDELISIPSNLPRCAPCRRS